MDLRLPPERALDQRLVRPRRTGSGVGGGVHASEGMEIPAELDSFNFARQKSRLAGTLRAAYFVIKGEC